MTIIIHAIFHAHLDPVWLWPWTSGLDEALATARSACDRLDAHPALFYTSGEVQVLEQIRRCDPRLWSRVLAHIRSGRWEVVNGWWTQPDCNFPSATGLRRQIRLGQQWIRQHLGADAPRCGFNPDSFGHCAAMPEILRACGQDRYVFMRPEQHELNLPAQVFTWRSRPGGPQVTALRIAGNYANGCTGVDVETIRRSTIALPPGCTHTLACFGVGDHGGGPTEALVRWVAEHPDIIPGARLEFSTIAHCFAAIAAEQPQLPEVIGELQQHAIGCYSVKRSTKSALRRAEQLLDRAEACATEDDQPRFEAAWRCVADNQFHDLCGGTCLPEAHRQGDEQLGGAVALGEEILAYGLRRRLNELPDDVLPRLIFANPGRDAFAGWCEATIYVEGIWKQGWRLVDGSGGEVPFQRLHPALGLPDHGPWALRRVLLRRIIDADALDVLRMDLSQGPAAIAPQVEAAAGRIGNGTGIALVAGPDGARIAWRDQAPLDLGLHLIADPSDTWSHGLDRYADEALATASWQPARILDHGPLMASLHQEGRIGSSRLSAEWRVHGEGATVDLLLEVHWTERHRLLKLVLPLGGEARRVDATPGLALERDNDGRELPVHGWVCTDSVGVVCPDVWAVDATPQRLRLTLLRSPLMAHHDPHPADFPRAETADQGLHRFRFRFHLASATAEVLAAETLAWERPPLVAELTRGMPARFIAYRTATEIER